VVPWESTSEPGAVCALKRVELELAGGIVTGMAYRTALVEERFYLTQVIDMSRGNLEDHRQRRLRRTCDKEPDHCHNNYYRIPHGLLPHADSGERTDNSKSAQEPQDNGNDHNGVQDRLDGARHWYESVDEPETNTNHDQDHDYVN
jgi:hypothetical protein